MSEPAPGGGGEPPAKKDPNVPAASRRPSASTLAGSAGARAQPRRASVTPAPPDATGDAGSGASAAGGRRPTRTRKSIDMQNRPPGDNATLPPPTEDVKKGPESMQVDSLINEESRKKARALVNHRWNILRAHVLRGFFHTVVRNVSQENIKPDDFITVVSKMWDQVMQSSQALHGRAGGLGFDSTTEFITSTWVRQRANNAIPSNTGAQGNAAAVAASSSNKIASSTSKTTASRATVPTAGATATAAAASSTAATTAAPVAPAAKATASKQTAGRAVQKQSPSDATTELSASIIETAHLGRGLGIEGMSLDTISGCNVGRSLMAIAKGLREPVKKDEANFVNLQVHRNRGWKLILLGLTQAESFSRYVAMIALNRAIPVIKETLVDNVTRFNLVSVLVNLVVSDERKENRLKAIYLIGQLGAALGSVREYHKLMLTAFKELAKKLLEIQYHESKQDESDLSLIDVKVHLFHAIGKYTHVTQKKSHFIEDLVMYMAHQELTLIQKQVIDPDTRELRHNNPLIFVIMSILGVLNNDMKRTEMNRKYVGALFKRFVHPLMRSINNGAQKMAIQFISTWLPVNNEDAVLQGIESIQAGLQNSKTLQVINFDNAMYEEQAKLISKWRYTEQIRLSMRSKLLRGLIQVPGTVAKLLPVPGCPGFFCDSDSSLLNTKSVLADLPIHGRSNVTLTRHIPQIPGAPNVTTTVPPLFMDEAWIENMHQPKSVYDFNERTGRIPMLPIGYTYAPNPILDSSDSMPQYERRDGAGGGMHTDAIQTTGRLPLVKNKAAWVNTDDIPRGATRIAPKLDQRGAISSGGTNSIASGATAEDQTVPESRRHPHGFDVVCPFPGFDPERIDRNSHPISPIYGRQMLAVRNNTNANQLNLAPLIGAGTTVSGRDNAGVGGQLDARNIQSPNDSRPGTVDPNEKENDSIMEEGYSYDCHPLLWPSPNPLLKAATEVLDFPLHAPVIIDIIQPHSPDLQRIMTKVSSINQDLSSVTVQRDSNEVGGLYIGAKFSIFIRTRADPSKWVAVQLEVLDDDYDDDMEFSVTNVTYPSGRAQTPHSREQHTLNEKTVARRNPAPPAMTKSYENTFSFPVPAGYTNLGEPYFSPAINTPPIPVGYDPTGKAYYGREANVKPFPLGITNMGTRFYPGDGKLVDVRQLRNQCCGFDIEGHPIFSPRGFSVPTPSGFTIDGIPFYDIPTLMRQRGIMMLPTTYKVIDSSQEDDTEEWEELLPKIYQENYFTTALQRHRAEASFVSNLSNSLKDSQPILKHTLAQAHSRSIMPANATRDGRLDQRDQADMSDGTDLIDPENVLEFLRGGLEFSHLKPTTMRIFLEPAQVDFQSVKAPVSKTVALRYRAGRGDRGERDYFLSVEPVDVFSLRTFHLRLQGEGVQEIIVTYTPSAMKSERAEGGLHLIDEYGKKMASCQLYAVRQSFFCVMPSTLDFGWVLPERRKEAAFKIENISPTQVTVEFFLKSEISTSPLNEESEKSMSTSMISESIGRSGSAGTKTTATSGAKASAFVIPIPSLRLQPLETKTMNIFFDPKVLGRATDIVEVRGPGGDVAHVEVIGMAGIPIAIYPESEEDSSAGCSSLSRERTELISKFRRHEVSDKINVQLNDGEAKVLRSIMAAQSDISSRREIHTLDFGIFSSDTKTVTRCLTFMNLGDGPATLSLFSHHPAITCPYLVRVAPRMANTVEVTMTIGEGAEGIRGNLRTTIEIVCPEFQNIPLNIKAFIGQAVYFPVWELVFFKPTHIGQRQELSVSLVNESQYDIYVSLEGITATPSSENNSFITTMSTSESDPTLCPAFSLIPVVFTFHAKTRGPLMKSLTIRMIKPFRRLFAAAMLLKQMRLIGICIESYSRRAEDKTDKNNIEFLIKWMGHPKTLVDEYPTDEQRYQLFDMNSNSGLVALAKGKTTLGEGYDIVFKADPYVTETQVPGIEDGLLGDDIFKSTSAANLLAVQNRGSIPKKLRFLSSTGFVLDPQYKLLQPGELQKLESYFNAPPDMGRLVTIYGFATALDESDHSHTSAQIIKRLASGILVLPILGSDHQVTIDFGKIELTGESMVENEKNLLLCNPHSTTYAWYVKFTSLKSKFNPFEAMIMTGEVTGYETFTVPFKFKCDVSGIYESACEIYITDTSDRFSKPMKVGSVFLRGVAVNTSLSGLPDSIDFGAVVVYNTKRKTYTLVNSGTSNLSVTALVRPPFTVTPKSFTITSKSQMDIEILFRPNEARNIQTKMQVFANQKLFLIPIVGLGGSAELVCEKYEDQPVDFGDIREGMIGWCSIYMTNKGTLPLKLKAVTTEAVGLPKLQFVSVTAAVPTEPSLMSSQNLRDVDQFEVKPNYWGILRAKYTLLIPSKSGLNFKMYGLVIASSIQNRFQRSKKKTGESHRQMENTGILSWVAMVPINHPSQITVAEATIPKIPELLPFYSYHFRLGYAASYRSAQECDLTFHYVPIMGEGESKDVPMTDLLKSTLLGMTGTAYRPLEVMPISIDFGYFPAERYLENALSNTSNRRETADYGVTQDKKDLDQSVMCVRVFNKSIIPQNLVLHSISPEFSIASRTWYVQAGEKLEIQIEFHPPREQIQYHGDAVFQHKYGVSEVHLTGTGASADLVADDMVNFGSLKLGTSGQRVLQVHNRGLLEARYELDIVQGGSDFRFLEGDPFECEGVIPSGGTKSHNIECRCSSIDGSNAVVLVKWRRIARGILERFTIPLKVLIGFPAFRMQNLEIDFKTTYIDVNKTVDFRFYNEGNASCNWRAEWENPSILLDVNSGTIDPGEAIVVKFTYSPTDYESLSTHIRFYTDAGNPTLMCYGVVGVPYLRVPREVRDIDFGIVSLERTHTRTLQMANTGNKVIDYEVVMLSTFKDGVEMGRDDFDAFYAEPATGHVESGLAITVNISIYPRDYNVLYASTYVLRTKDGEQYSGRVTAKGGKAIIKIKAPTIAPGETRKAITSEPRGVSSAVATLVAPKAAHGYDLPKVPVRDIEASRYVLQSHLDNLYEVLAGLRSAELDMTREKEAVPEIPSSVQAQLPTSPPKKGSTGAGGTAPVGSNNMRGPGFDPSISKQGSNPQPEQSQKSSASQSVASTKKQVEPIVLDGSDLRLQSRGGMGSRGAEKGTDISGSPARGATGAKIPSTSSSVTTVPHTPGSRPDSKQASGSHAVKFTDELSQLEKELEIAIGLRDPVASIVSGSGSGSGSGSAPGTAEVESKPGSPAKKHAGGLGKYQPGRRRGHRHREPEEDSPLQTKPPSQGSRGMTPIAHSGSTAAIEDSILRSFSSRGLINAGLEGVSNIALAEVQAQKSKIESILSLAQEMTLATGFGLDKSGQQELLDIMNTRVLDNTHLVIKAVQEQLSNDKWVPNREFLQQALRRLQMSTVAIENFKQPVEEEPLDENTFDLGLICGGDKSASMLLFSIPNEGNISFDFHIVANKNEVVHPPDDDHTFENSPFQVDPLSGTLQPNESVNLSASFQANIPGMYRQGYSVMSGDEIILSFSVIARVGIPNLVVSSHNIDYGLVEKGKSVSKMFVISNTGGYQEFWRLIHCSIPAGSDMSQAATFASSSEEELANSPFKLAIDSGETKSADTTPIEVVFTPSSEGEFRSLVKIVCSKEPLIVELSGTGGGSRLEFSYEEDVDKTFGGLDFGVCSVGLTYTKKMRVRNLGTVTGQLEISHPNRSVVIELQRDDDGAVSLAPGASVELTVTLNPEKTEFIKDPIQIFMGSSGTQTVTFRARCGKHDWKIEGALDFLNMPILESQVKMVSVVNTGSLDLPVEFTLLPDKFKNIVNYTAKADNWVSGRSIRPGQVIKVEVTVGSDTKQVVGGVIQVKTKMRGEPVVYDLPFNFRIYVDEIAMDDTSDVTVGRVMVGQSAVGTRNISNFGNNKIKYRARIEAVNDKGSETLAWKIKGETEGFLDANETADIEAIFESLDGKGDDWQEATLIIERLVDDGTDTWSVLSNVKLVGAAGKPDLTIVPSEIDFGPTGLGAEGVQSVMLINGGNAILNYEVVTPWDAFDEFKLFPDFPPQGTVNAGESYTLKIKFLPQANEYYTSTITIKTPIGDRFITIQGEGACYQVHKPSLPDSIEFGEVNVAGSKTIELEIENGCMHEIDVKLEVYDEDPSVITELPRISEYVTVQPNAFRLRRNESEVDRTKITTLVCAAASARFDEEGLISNEFLGQFPIGRLFNFFLKVDVAGGDSDIIPVSLIFVAKPPVLLAKQMEPNEVTPEDVVTKVEFGSVSIDGGGKRKYFLLNTNAFRVKFKLEVDHQQFSVLPTSGILNPESSRDIIIDLKGIELDGEEAEIPKSEEFACVLSLTTNVESFPMVHIPVSGMLVDQAPVLELPEDIMFGDIFRQKSRKIELTVRNPARRPLRWRFYVDRAFADIFVVKGLANDVTPAKENFSLTIVFCPAIDVSYQATGFFESDAGNFTIPMYGKGVAPVIEVEQTSFDFGIVGIDVPEFRMVTIKNPLDLRMRLRARFNNKAFGVDVNEFVIKPNQSYTMKVNFLPTVKGREEHGSVAIFNLEDLPSDENDGMAEEIELASSDKALHTKPSNPRKELELLKEVSFVGVGGEFGFRAEGVETSQTAPKESTGFVNSINIVFKKVNQRQRTRKSFDVENCGDTNLELGIFDMAGAELENQKDYDMASKLCHCRISPTSTLVPPHSSEKVTVTVQGIDTGDDTFEFMIHTRNLVNPKSIKVLVNVHVLSSAVDESLRAFARADMSLDVLLNVALQEEERYATERDLWKVVLPIVRIAAVPPSQDMQTIPRVEPNSTQPDIGPYLIRPPAIPASLPPRNKKWYINRVSMALEGYKSQEDITEEYVRRQEAIDFVQPLEKKYVLEKKRGQ